MRSIGHRGVGQNSFDHIPAAVIGASIGQIGTAVAQQSLRGVLSFLQRPADDRARSLYPLLTRGLYQ